MEFTKQVVQEGTNVVDCEFEDNQKKRLDEKNLKISTSPDIRQGSECYHCEDDDECYSGRISNPSDNTEYSGLPGQYPGRIAPSSGVGRTGFTYCYLRIVLTRVGKILLRSDTIPKIINISFSSIQMDFQGFLGD